jgi:hypothetical protein
MSRNGSGVYSLPAGNPVTTATTISSTWANNTLTDIANALTGSLSADGQTPLTGNLNVNNNNLTNVATIGSVTSNNSGTATTATLASTTINNSGTANTLNLVTTGTVTGGTGVVNYGSGQFYKDTAGNIGVGITPSAWSSSAKAIQLSSKSSIYEYSGVTAISSNYYIDSTPAIKYITTNPATSFTQDTSGNFTWYNAPSGTASTTATLSSKLSLNLQGQLTLGTNVSAIVGSSDAYYQCVNSSPVGQYVAGQTSSLWWSFGRDNVSTGYFVFAPLGTTISYINTTTGVYTAVSDRRLKKNITPLRYGLKEVLALNPVMYNMKTEDDTKKKHIGLIAQEVKAIIDEAVEDIDETKQSYGLSATELVPVLIKAIQELNARIVVLEAKK